MILVYFGFRNRLSSLICLGGNPILKVIVNDKLPSEVPGILMKLQMMLSV